MTTDSATVLCPECVMPAGQRIYKCRCNDYMVTQDYRDAVAGIDYVMLDRQYRTLIDLIELVRDDDAFPDVSQLDGLVAMIGDMLDEAGVPARDGE